MLHTLGKQIKTYISDSILTTFVFLQRENKVVFLTSADPRTTYEANN